MRRVAPRLAAAAIAVAACGREPDRHPHEAQAQAQAPPPPPVLTVDAAAAAPIAAGDLWFPDAATIGERVRILADPSLRGRGGGTADEAVAADKVAAWLRQAGVEPGGADGDWLQPFARPDGGHSQNVVAILRGSDPHAGHVIVGAHYDHLGMMGGELHPGADDNASGVAGLCAIAEALAHAGQRPAVTVVFVAFGSEEDGLWGSEHYAAHPRFPLADARVMINLDMIGRAKFLSAKDYALARALVPDDAIGALTTDGARDLALAAKAAGELEHRPVVASSDFGAAEALIRPAVETRGDHASFSAYGVRYLWLSTSMHDDYHLPSDTADKVDPATIATVGRIVVRVIRGLPSPPASAASGQQ